MTGDFTSVVSHQCVNDRTDSRMADLRKRLVRPTRATVFASPQSAGQQVRWHQQAMETFAQTRR